MDFPIRLCALNDGTEGIVKDLGDFLKGFFPKKADSSWDPSASYFAKFDGWRPIKYFRPVDYSFCLVYGKSPEEERSNWSISIARWEEGKWVGLDSSTLLVDSFYKKMHWDLDLTRVTHWKEIVPPTEEELMNGHID